MVEADHLARGVEDAGELLGEGQRLLERGREAGELLLVARELFERPALLVDLPEQPRILNGEDGLGREGLEQVHDRRRERPRGLPPDHQPADHAVFAQERDSEERTVSRFEHERQRVARLALEVRDLDGGARRGRLADPALADADADMRLAKRLDQFLGHAVVRSWYEDLRGLVELVDGAGVGLRELDRMRDDAGEDRLDVQAGADRLPYLAERPQLLHRACQFLRSLLQFVEQAHILDGDHRLVGEGLEERDLSLREELRLGTEDRDRANRDTFSHQGNAEGRAEAQASRVRAALREFAHVGLQVSDVDRPPR